MNGEIAIGLSNYFREREPATGGRPTISMMRYAFMNRIRTFVTQ